MANQLKSDELNVYNKSTTKRSIPYKKYFGEMDLTDKEKEIRIALAEKFEQVFLFFFVMIGVELAIGNEIEVAYYYAMVERKFNEALEDSGYSPEDYPYLFPYIQQMAKDIVDVTIANTKPEDKDKKPDLYFTSEDRAMFIAENESNAVRNLIQLENAIKAGYTKKKWVTMRDRKVRHSHVLVDGETIGIYDAFEVGDSMMMFPKDTSMGADAKEIVNCRCVCKYRK